MGMQGRSLSRCRTASLSNYSDSEKSFTPYSPETASPQARHKPWGRNGEEKTLKHGTPQIAARSDYYMKPTKTSAERTRELSILSDPLANLLSPDYVECKQCRKKIKLSSKSAYDTFHWRNHRKRCIKSFKKKGKQRQPSPATLPSSPSTSRTIRSKGLKPLDGSSTPVSRGPKTPPLISDNEEDHRSELSSEAQSPLMVSQSMPTIRKTPSTPYFDYNVQDYLGRSHPGYVPRHTTSHSWCTTSSPNPQNWSWSHLKPSRFSTVNHDDEDEDDGEDDDLSVEESLDAERVQEAARTLSMLSRSR